MWQKERNWYTISSSKECWLRFSVLLFVFLLCALSFELVYRVCVWLNATMIAFSGPISLNDPLIIIFAHLAPPKIDRRRVCACFSLFSRAMRLPNSLVRRRLQRCFFSSFHFTRTIVSGIQSRAHCRRSIHWNIDANVFASCFFVFCSVWQWMYCHFCVQRASP